MGLLIIVILVVIGLVIYGVSVSSKQTKLYEENKERREKYVQSKYPNANIIVNNGIHLFFKDDKLEMFGFEESGKTYSYSGLLSISVFKDSIFFIHKTTPGSFFVGKDRSNPGSQPLDLYSSNAILNAMRPVLRKNLHDELAVHAITPTYEYEYEGTIYGCDINSRMFYMTYGSIQVYPFSDLRRIQVEDWSNNNLCDANYSIKLYLKSNLFPDDDEIEIYFQSMDSTFNNLLAMFKEIRKRRY